MELPGKMNVVGDRRRITAHGLAPRGVAEGNQHHLVTHAFCASLSSL